MADDKIVIGIEADLAKLITDVQKSKRVSGDFADDFDKGLKGVDKEVDEVGKSLNMVGDRSRTTSKSVVRDFDRAEDAARDFDRRIDKVGNGFSGISSKAARMGGMLTKALTFGAIGAGIGTAVVGIGTAVVGTRKLIDVGFESVDLFRVQQKAVNQLNASLEATGGAAGFTSEELQQYASHLQTLTNVGDETTLAMMSIQTAFKNVRGENFLRVTELAQDMSEATGKDAVQSAELLSKALNDPLKGMRQLERSGVRLTEQQQEQVSAFIDMNDVAGAQAILLDEIEARYGGSAQAAANAEGNFTQLWNRVGDVKEIFGGLIVQVLDEFTPAFETVVAVLENGMTMFTTTGDHVSGLSGVFSSVGDTLREWGKTTLEVFTMGEVLIENYNSVFEAMGASVALSVVGMGEDFKFYFTDQIPAWLDWFFNNWNSLLNDMNRLQLVVLDNMWDNFQNFFTNIVSLMAGGSVSFEWTPITEGFKSTLRSLPPILERETSELEKILQEKLDGSTTDLSEAYKEKLETNLEFLNTITTKNEAAPPVMEDKSEKVEGTDLATKKEEKEKKEEKKPEPKKEETLTQSEPVPSIEIEQEENKEPEQPDLSEKDDLKGLNERIQNASLQYQEVDLEQSRESNILLGQVVDAVKEIKIPTVEDMAFNAGEMLGEAAFNANDMLKGAIDGFIDMFDPHTDSLGPDLESMEAEDAFGSEEEIEGKIKDGKEKPVDNTSEFKTLISDQKELISLTDRLISQLPFNGVLG